ncbi:MAG TPA: cell wall-binding repeat-containing protein [Solirubrobacteraceae bacterium]|nr:cell wall-binding repeat-containing protein [Solirubrobacteraceae bacterium]
MRARVSRGARRGAIPAIAGLVALALSACGGGTKLLHSTTTVHRDANGGISSSTPQAAQKLGFPLIATKNTTRVNGADPVADAAGVALAVFPSDAAGTHPTAVTLAPTGDWQAAIAASVLMAPPIHAPVLLSGSTSLPAATADALTTLAPAGSGAASGAQVIRVGAVPTVKGMRSAAINGSDPYTLAAGIDRFFTAVAGQPSKDVVIASATSPAYAMPAAGWAAESGNPILFVGASGIPAPTRQALLTHSKPHIYVLGPPNVIPDATMTQLGKYGTVKRVSGADPAANSVAFTIYRDPACPFGQACAHVPNSFGWALRSPGHGYVLLNASRPLDAAAAAALSGSGDYGPDLLVENASTLPKVVLNYFLDYATPGYTQEGPTVAVYNHGWMIGDPSAISPPVQAEVDRLLELQPVAQNGQGQ